MAKKPVPSAGKLIKLLDTINESNMDMPTEAQIIKETEKLTVLIEDVKQEGGLVMIYPKDEGNQDAFESKIWACNILKISYIGRAADGAYQFTTVEKITQDAAAAAAAGL